MSVTLKSVTIILIKLKTSKWRLLNQVCKLRSIPGVNVINVLQAAFARADPKSAKNTVKSSVLFVLSGSLLSKAARSTMMKLTPDRC